MPLLDGRLRLAPGARIVQTAPERASIVADHLRLSLEGPFATFLVERLGPLLDGSLTGEEIYSRLGPVDRGELIGWLTRLVENGAIVASNPSRATDPGPFTPARHFLRALGVGDDGFEHIRSLRVGIVGLEGPGAQGALSLASLGVGHLVLVDPVPCSPADLGLSSAFGTGAVGRPRQSVLAETIQSGTPDINVAVGADRPLERDALAELTEGCDVIAHCYDTGFLASAHWVNQLALDRHQRAVFGRIESHRALVGPFVLPGEGPCFLCWRMRVIACVSEVEEAMAYERQLDAERRPALGERTLLPPLGPMVGAVMAMEIVKVLAGFGHPALPGHVWEFDALTMRTSLHAVLQRPDCPACRKKGLPPPAQPGLSGLRGAAGSTGDLLSAVDDLVSSSCGIVRTVRPVPRDPSEPAAPFVMRAELANHRFARDEDRFTVCSGKGMTRSDALLSALGEAVERYGAHAWHQERIVRCRRASVPGQSLDPTRLVLYTEAQYGWLPYAPWSEETEMDWVPATSLADGSAVHVPALAVFMDYQVGSHDEFLFPITSNGLAAGRSVAHAVLRGLLEVVERDAFLLSWMHRLAGGRLELDAVPDEDVRALASAYRRRGVQLEVVLLPTDHPACVALAVGVDTNPGPDRPAAVVGLGADVDPVLAVRRAVLEVGQVRPALRARMRDPATGRRLAELLADPQAVRELDDHDLLFAHDSKLGELDFWLSSATVPCPPAPLTPSAPGGGDLGDLAPLSDGLQAAGYDVLYVNLTPPDVAALGVAVVRVIVPDFQPIHFGAREARLGGRRLEREGELNLHPHPLA